jgi:hypothetical protein
VHEIDNLLDGYPMIESRMDMHNNEVGLNAALRGDPIPDRSNSQLLIIDAATGNLVGPYSKVS